MAELTGRMSSKDDRRRCAATRCNAMAGVFRAPLEDPKQEESFIGKDDDDSSSYAGLSFLFDEGEIGIRFERL